jgi:hypothetical protein
MAMTETLERWAQLQILPPEEFRKLVTLPGITMQDLDVSADDKAWARRNIMSLKNGVVPNLMAHMMFTVHFEETATYMKKAEFFTLQPEIQGLFVDYLTQLQAVISNPPAEGNAEAPP